VQVIVQRRAPFLDTRVILSRSFISIDDGELEHSAGVSDVLNELVGCLTESQDLPRQVNFNCGLEVAHDLVFEVILLHHFLNLALPLVVVVHNDLIKLVFLEEVSKLDAADFLVVANPFCLPASAFEELLESGEEQDEAERQERHKQEEHDQEQQEQEGHVGVFPPDQVTRLLSKVTDNFHPLQSQRSALLCFLVGVHHALALYIVCHLGLRNSVISFPARFQQLVNVLHLVNVVLCQNVVVHHQARMEQVVIEEDGF